MPRSVVPDGRGNSTLRDDAFAEDLGEYRDLCNDIKRLEEQKKALREKIEAKMLEVGANALEAGGFRASIYHRDDYGFCTEDESGHEVDPDELDRRRDALQRFFKKYAPGELIPASNRIARAWEAYLGTLPEEKRDGTEPPAWLKVHKTPTLRISGQGA